MSYDHESRTFCALLKLDDGENVLVRTKSTRVQSTLETAYVHDDQVTVQVVHQPDVVSLVEVYEAIFVQT